MNTLTTSTESAMDYTTVPFQTMPVASYPEISLVPKRPSKYEWQARLGIIQHYYFIECRPLPEVMNIMEREYGFTANKKMYKSQLGKLRWAKNRSARAAKLLPPAPRLPNIYGPSDKIFRCIFMYVVDSLDSGSWGPDELGDFCRRDGRDKGCSYEEFKRTVCLAMEMHSLSTHQHGEWLRPFSSSVFTAAFHVLEDVMREEHPLTVIQILTIVGALYQRHDGVLRHLLVYLRFLVQQESAQFPELHPLRVIFYELVELLSRNMGDSAVIQPAIREFCKTIVDGFVLSLSSCKHRINPLLVAYQQQHKIYDAGTRDRLAEEFPQLLRASTRQAGHSSHMSLQLSYWWLNYAEHFRRLGHCKEIASDMLWRADQHKSQCADRNCWLIERAYYAAYEVLGNIAKAEGRYTDAEVYWRRAIDHRFEYDRRRGRGDSTGGITKTLRLYTWFIQRGEVDKAAELRNSLLNVLSALRLKVEPLPLPPGEGSSAEIQVE